MGWDEDLGGIMEISKKKLKKQLKEKVTITNEIFNNLGFDEINSKDIHCEINGESSEIDHIYLYENLIILCEKTLSQDIDSHFPKKQKFYNQVLDDENNFINEYSKINIDFRKKISINNTYDIKDYLIRAIYASEKCTPNSSTLKNYAPLHLLTPSLCQYFKALTKTIKQSAKYEMFNFLDVDISQIGEESLSGSSGSNQDYDGIILPNRHTKYPEGFSIASFYVDPKTLLERACVLRRDAWSKAELSYQRLLVSKKISKMRDYLCKDGKVFVNNLIITLPSNVSIKDKNKNPINGPINEKQHVTLGLPRKLASIGIIDGQHRIYSYYEGTGEDEQRIAPLRTKQNLLVTGIIFPSEYTNEQKTQFEADLFLKINDTQTRVHSSLKQELEIIINPYSTVALSKKIINKLCEKGPLENILQKNVYDDSLKIKSASITSYGLIPLINIKGVDSLFKIWKPDPSINKEDSIHLWVDQYIDYCVKIINLMLAGPKVKLAETKSWKVKKEKGILTATSISGLMRYLIQLIASGESDLENINYIKTFQHISPDDFEGFVSSGWAKLSKNLFKKFPPIRKDSKQQ